MSNISTKLLLKLGYGRGTGVAYSSTDSKFYFRRTEPAPLSPDFLKSMEDTYGHLPGVMDLVKKQVSTGKYEVALGRTRIILPAPLFKGARARRAAMLGPIR